LPINKLKREREREREREKPSVRLTILLYTNNLIKKNKGEGGGRDPPYSTRLDLHPY